MKKSLREALFQKKIELLLDSKEYKQELEFCVQTIVRQSKDAINEASVVSVFELELFTLIQDIFGKKFFPQKEISIDIDTNFHVAKGRIDSKIGALVIEFKHYSALQTKIQKEKASNQIKAYLKGLYHTSKQNYFGIVTDGVQCKIIILNEGGFIENPFQSLCYEILDKIVRAAIIMDKKELNPQNLVHDFAENEDSISHKLSKTLFHLLKNEPTGRSIMLFNEWKELFRLAHDDKSKQKAIEERRESLEMAVGETFPKNDNELEYKALYAIQTTYAIIVKIIAYKVISLLHLKRSFIDFKTISESDSEVVLRTMQSLEDGAIFRDFGVGNLLEGDFFSWYCADNQWKDEISKNIKAIFSILTLYEDKGIYESIDKVQDLFKDLFMKIIPEKVRHSLGEYYTPSWLADNLINEAINKLDDKNNWTALDPCSGSGTFITILIRKVLKETENLSKKERLNAVLKRVMAIDLNPLAVLTTRINYFTNIISLISIGEKIEIPVFLGDSSYVPKVINVDKIKCFSYSIQTVKGSISITLPISICKDPLQFSKIMTDIEQNIKNQDTDGITKKLISIIPNDEQTNLIIEHIQNLAKKFVFLESNNWNGIWARIITNFITTAALGKFDLIVGNPPWIDWKNLPTGYRERIKQVCIDKKLFSGDKITGGINLNICALITFVCATNWLKDKGVLAFLMPNTILFQQTYEGFRELNISPNRNLYFNQIFNWTQSGNPFKPVTQNFYTYFISYQYSNYRKGIPFISFIKKNKKSISSYFNISDFNQIKEIFNIQHDLVGQTQTNSTKFSICESTDELEKFSNIVGKMEYKGREGIEFYPQELFILSYEEDVPSQIETVAVKNFQNTKSKYKVPIETFILEKEFLFPLVKGTDIERFHLKQSNYIVPFPYLNGHREPIPIIQLSSKAPLLAKFFNRFKSLINSQTDYNSRIIGEKNNTEFYALARVGTYSFAPYHVAFRDNTEWCACVVSQLKTPWGEFKLPQFQNHAVTISQTIGGRNINLDEAHYICAILNSSIVTKYIAKSSDARTFKIDPEINIPLFDGNNPIHNRLAEISKLAHENYNSPHILRNIDSELDTLVLAL